MIVLLNFDGFQPGEGFGKHEVDAELETPQARDFVSLQWKSTMILDSLICHSWEATGQSSGLAQTAEKEAS